MLLSADGAPPETYGEPERERLQRDPEKLRGARLEDRERCEQRRSDRRIDEVEVLRLSGDGAVRGLSVRERAPSPPVDENVPLVDVHLADDLPERRRDDHDGPCLEREAPARSGNHPLQPASHESRLNAPRTEGGEPGSARRCSLE